MPLDVNGEHGVPVVLGQVHNGAALQDSGVAQDDIQPAEELYGRLHETLHLGHLGHVLVVNAFHVKMVPGRKIDVKRLWPEDGSAVGAHRWRDASQGLLGPSQQIIEHLGRLMEFLDQGG